MYGLPYEPEVPLPINTKHPGVFSDIIEKSSEKGLGSMSPLHLSSPNKVIAAFVAASVVWAD